MKSLIWLVVLLPTLVIADNWVWHEVKDYEPLKQALIDASNLKDPFSARFRDVFSREVDSTGTIAWCGQINSKNSYGAYGGFQSFNYVYLAGSDSEEIFLLDPQDALYEAWIIMFDAVCEGTPYSNK